MPSPKRRPKLRHADLSDLSSLEDTDLERLFRAGEVSPGAYRDELTRRVIEKNGGIHPYAHLRLGREPRP